MTPAGTRVMVCLVLGLAIMGRPRSGVAAGTAKDGQGNITVTPNSVLAGSTNDYVFSYRTPKNPFNPGAQLALQVPAGWSAPQTNNPAGAGFITLTPVLSATGAITSITGTGPWVIGLNFASSQNHAGFDIGYKAAVGPTNSAIYTFITQSAQSGGSLRNIRSGSPTVTVDNPAKTNTTVSLGGNLNPSTYGNAVTFTATVVGSGTKVPTGTLTFLQGAVTMGTVPVNGSAQATCTTNRFSVPDSPVWITAQYSGDTNYNPSVSAVLLQTVNPASLSVTGVAAPNKIYDGTTNAVLDFSAATLSPGLPGDDVSLDPSAATGGFSDANAGVAKPVTVSGLGLGGTTGGNYALTQINAVSASILTAPLTVSAKNTNRYFGEPNPAFTASYSGFVPGDGQQVLSGSPAFSTTAVPSSSVAGSPYPINVTNGTLAAANYYFQFLAGQLTIVAKPVYPQRIVSINRLADGRISVVCSGAAGQAYILQSTPSLVVTSWGSVQTNTTDATGMMTCVDASAATNGGTRFYRTALP